MTTALNLQKTKPAALADINPSPQPIITEMLPLIPSSIAQPALHDGFCMGAKFYNPPLVRKAEKLSAWQTTVPKNVVRIVSGNRTCSI
ncbi:MAG: hypothetical protein K940chlam8_00202 [Chlamydiae bacterium]|nr:hypothetical protein [Chlamydiota bacterium]